MKSRAYMVENQGQKSARHQIERGQVSAWQGGMHRGTVRAHGLQRWTQSPVTASREWGVPGQLQPGPRSGERAKVTCSAGNHGSPFCSAPVKTLMITWPYPDFGGPTVSQ